MTILLPEIWIRVVWIFMSTIFSAILLSVVSVFLSAKIEDLSREVFSKKITKVFERIAFQADSETGKVRCGWDGYSPYVEFLSSDTEAIRQFQLQIIARYDDTSFSWRLHKLLSLLQNILYFVALPLIPLTAVIFAYSQNNWLFTFLIPVFAIVFSVMNEVFSKSIFWITGRYREEGGLRFIYIK